MYSLTLTKNWPVLVSQTTSRAAVFAVLAFLTGCVSSPERKLEELAISPPSAWSAMPEQVTAFEPQSWTDDFDDPQLERIVDEALAHNLDLEAAAARMDAALASAVSNRAGFWPSLNASGSGSKARRSSASGIQQTPTAETYGLSARFAWEIDLWGKLRNGYKAALADEEAAIADYLAARLSIAARTAKAWYAAIEAIQQLELETRSLDALESSAQIVEESFASGIAGALDVRLVRANLASARSTLEQRERVRDAAVRSLETLLGRYPANELEVATSLPDLEEVVPIGMPSELLLRRPDVIAAERRLAAAEQRKFEAGKARLPSIDLSLVRGTSDSNVENVFDFVERRIWSQSLNVAQPLFQGGRLAANHRRSRADYEQAVANYSLTVLNAFREVENALGEQDSFARDYAYLQVAAQESVQAEELAWEEYGRGLSDITTALESVRRSIAARRSLIQVSSQRIQSRIDLYLALGGGLNAELPADS